MITLEVNMADASVRKTLASVSAAVSAESAAKAASEAVADVVRDNFIALARVRHRPGQRLNYYLQAADSVIREASGGAAAVLIPHTGVSLRYHGGTVFPSGRPSKVTGKPIRHLAIGLIGTPGEGHVPADFADLFVVGGGDDDGKAVLGRDEAGGFQALFALVSKAVQPADPTVLPQDGAMLEAAAESILDIYDAATEARP